MAVRGDGRIHWSTPQAARLVNAATGRDDELDIIVSHVAAFMQERRASGESALSITREGRTVLQLAFLGAIGPDEYLFRLTAASRADDEILRQRFALSQRESEVLLWIAKGKANRDIGEILGLSARTVNRHLEQTYAKLGVENRASAAVKAAHALHEV